MNFEAGWFDLDGVLRFPAKQKPRQQNQDRMYRWCRRCESKTQVDYHQFAVPQPPICRKCWLIILESGERPAA